MKFFLGKDEDEKKDSDSESEVWLVFLFKETNIFIQQGRN